MYYNRIPRYKEPKYTRKEPDTMKRQKNFRKLKVYSQSGYHYRDTPTIQLKGLWLKDLGFDSDTPIAVQCENGKITIVPREPEKEVIVTTVTRNGVCMVAEERVVYR